MTERVKDAEAHGYTYEAADASFELLLLEELNGQRTQYFTVESWRAIVPSAADRAGTPATAEATVKLTAGGERIVSTGEGVGPVNALDHALRQALLRVYPELEQFELIGFKVRILDSNYGTDAITRVLIEMSDGVDVWSTVRCRPEPARGVIGGAHGLGRLGASTTTGSAPRSNFIPVEARARG